MLQAGIVGLPNVGKSTLFNAVTRTRKAQAANYPFCTIDPNVGMVTVPDPRLQVLRFTGPISIEDDAIQIGPLASTKMFCEGKSETEAQYFAALEAARSFTTDGSLVSLKDESGKVILKFKK